MRCVNLGEGRNARKEDEREGEGRLRGKSKEEDDMKKRNVRFWIIFSCDSCCLSLQLPVTFP